MGLSQSKSKDYTGQLPLQSGYSLSYWLQNVRSSPLLGFRSSQTIPSQADYVIIGSGMSGCTMAYFLMTDPKFPRNSTVIMLDSRDFCSNASARNGGHCRPDSFNAFHKFEELFGKKTALELVQLEADNLVLVEKMVNELDIDCDFWTGECANIFMSDKGMAEAVAQVETFKANGGRTPLRIVKDPEQARKETRVKGARGAVYYPAGSFYPFKFCENLMQFCIQRGLNFQSRTHVHAVHKEEKGLRVVSSRGNILAGKVIHCTNAFAAAAVPELTQHIKPYRGTNSAIVPTRAFSGKNMLQTSQIITWDDKQTRAAKKFDEDEYLIQRHSDGTIILGGGAKDPKYLGATDDSVVDESSASYLKSYMRKQYDEWGSEAIGEGMRAVWSGIMARTPDHLPLVGRFRDNEFLNVAHNGHGMARIPIISQGLAKLVLSNSDAPFSITNLPSPLEYTPERAAWT